MRASLGCRVFKACVALPACLEFPEKMASLEKGACPAQTGNKGSRVPKAPKDFPDWPDSRDSRETRARRGRTAARARQVPRAPEGTSARRDPPALPDHPDPTGSTEREALPDPWAPGDFRVSQALPAA